MFRTRITDLFGIEHPIIQGGMRYVARAEVAAAVADGGGIGFISAHTQPTGEALLQELERARALTNKPFGVNLTILPHLRGARPEDYVEAIIASGVKFVETAGANPAPWFPRLKAAGIVILHKCTSVRFALKAQALGADAVSVAGFEAGGHPGEDPTPAMVMIPLLAKQLKIPFISSGGFATGAGLVAALALGAEGISLGTRFMLSTESPMHEAIKRRMLAATERDTLLILTSIGDTTRVLANAISKCILEAEKAGSATVEELLDFGGGPRWVAAAERGDVEGGAFALGLSAALIDEILPAAEIVRRIVAEAKDIIAQRFGVH